MPYYAVHKGRNGAAIYHSWPEWQKAVKDFHGAIFKKFDTLEDAETFKKVGFGDHKPKFIQKRENAETKNHDEIDSVLHAEDAHRNLLIYTDGSLIRNDGHIYCGYGIVIPELNIKLAEKLNDPKKTNNRAEMRAILHAIELLDEDVKSNRRLCIFTDSQYCKYIFQGTGERYEKANYRKDGEEVPNKDMIITALSYLRKYDIAILKVRAHTDATDIHSKYNDMADKLANNGAMQTKGSKKSYLEEQSMYHDSIIHPFEKREIQKAYTPQVDDDGGDVPLFNNSYRYNDDMKWREEERRKFEGKTKMTDIFGDIIESQKEETPRVKREETYSVKIMKNKPMRFKNTTIGDFLSPKW